MGFDESDVGDDGDGGGKSLNSSLVSCSICLESVTDNGDRSWAKLQCGHQFHLDCIGSAFNIKGAMQCPNCRKIEKGQWLFGNGCRSFADISFEDWPHDEDLYEMGYSEMSFGLQWCPITAFPQLPSSFEEGEFPSTSYHGLGQRAVFAEHTAMSSSHPCPYVAYYGPIHSSSSNSSGGVSDNSNFSSHWGSPSSSSEMPSSYGFAALDPHYHSWEHHSLPFLATGSRLGGSDQPSVSSVTQRSTRANSDLPRSGSFLHPFIVSHREGEFPSTAYNDLGQRAVFPEHNAMPSSHPCPSVAYYGPIHSSSSNSSGGVSDNNFSSHWGSPPGSSEMPSSFAFAALDPHYHSWEHHSLPFLATGSRVGGTDQPSVPSQRSTRANSDLPRSGSFVHPFIVSHSSSTRVGSPVTSSLIPPYPGSTRARDRVQALQAYFQPPSTSPPMRPPIISGTRRPSGPRALSQVGPPSSSSDQSGGFYIFPSGTSSRSFSEAESPVSGRFLAWERDHPSNFPLNLVERESNWGGFQHATGSSGSFRQRHGSERPSQNRSS